MSIKDKIHNIDDYETRMIVSDLLKKKPYSPKTIYFLYKIAGITPHELKGQEPPPYKILARGGWSISRFCRYLKQTGKKESMKFKKIKDNPLTLNHIITILDESQGLISLDWFIT